MCRIYGVGSSQTLFQWQDAPAPWHCRPVSPELSLSGQILLRKEKRASLPQQQYYLLPPQQQEGRAKEISQRLKSQRIETQTRLPEPSECKGLWWTPGSKGLLGGSEGGIVYILCQVYGKYYMSLELQRRDICKELEIQSCTQLICLIIGNLKYPISSGFIVLLR